MNILTETLKERIEELHAEMKKSPCETLREEFLMCNWDNEKKKRILDDRVKAADMMQYMAEGKSGDFKQFGVYTKIDCQYVYKRSDFIPKIDRVFPYLLDNPNPTVKEIRDVSIMCRNYSSVLLPIKIFVVNKNMEGRYTGVQPVTSPVKATMNWLFGNIQDFWDHTLMCQEWAREWGVSPTHVNSWFWILGKS